MQQKILRYILFGGVALIWGLIIFKIINATGQDPIPIKSVTNHHFDDKEFEEYTLNMDYPDPFLTDTMLLRDTVAAPAITASSAPVTTEITKPDLSFIQYHGMISNPAKKTKVGLIKLNGKDMLVREKEEIGEVEIKKIGKEELSIFFHHKKYSIRKNQPTNE